MFISTEGKKNRPPSSRDKIEISQVGWKRKKEREGKKRRRREERERRGGKVGENFSTSLRARPPTPVVAARIRGKRVKFGDEKRHGFRGTTSIPRHRAEDGYNTRLRFDRGV